MTEKIAYGSQFWQEPGIQNFQIDPSQLTVMKYDDFFDTSQGRRKEDRGVPTQYLVVWCYPSSEGGVRKALTGRLKFLKGESLISTYSELYVQERAGVIAPSRK